MPDPFNIPADEKKTRKRPRTKSIRLELKNKIESALLLKKSPILHLFISANDTELVAPLDSVLPILGYGSDNPITNLSKVQLRSISNKSRVFKIIGNDDEPLKLTFDKRNRQNLEDKTVYVDNLPLSCSADQLRRRAGIFGTVVHIHIPTVNRLRRRHCVGVESPLNSGFAFLQFSSKTAVRRFCKRYAANCHLNRTHHSKTHRKRKSQLNVSGVNASTNNIDQDSAKTNNDSLVSQTQPTSTTGHSTNEVHRKRRSTEVSVSGIDSGTESDFARPFQKTNNETATKEKKKRRKKRKPKSNAMAFSLTKFLSKIQVFSYPKYKELRREYTDTKNNNLKALKANLNERDLIHTQNDIENIDFNTRADGTSSHSRKRKRQRSRRQETGTSDQRRRKKHRSRANVLKIATRLKDESFAIPYMNSTY